MTCLNNVENSKYKLLGFEGSKGQAIVMVVDTGKVIKLKLDALLSSEILNNLTRQEVKSVCKKYYSPGVPLTAYDIKDRHEVSWMVYISLNLLLFMLYIFTSVAAVKPLYLEGLEVIVTPGTFLYPLTFLIVDILNEYYGFRLARRAIFFAFASNALIIMLLSATTVLPGLPGWALEVPYAKVVSQLSSVLVASSVSFLVSEYVNSYVLCKIKELTNARWLYIRVFLSTVCAVVIDSVLFCFIAFYGVMAMDDILAMLYVQIAIKIAFAFFNVLPAYGVRSLFEKYMKVKPVSH